MKISTKGKNAIKIMLELGTYYGSDPVKLKDIARRQNISEKYLEQIISILLKAALVKSIRGKGGGYVLKYPPEKYTVGQILKAAEGDMAPTDCVSDLGGNCGNKEVCVSYRLWKKLDDAIDVVLEGITLADMLEWQTELQGDQYVI